MRPQAAGEQRRVFELERLSTTDRLTGLWNRRHFDEVVPREIAFSENERSPMPISGPPGLVARIDPVLAAIREHFKDEEKVLAEVGYPLLAQHRDLHRKLLETAGQLRADVGTGKASAGEILEFIAYEVVNRHVLKADRLFFPFLKRRG